MPASPTLRVKNSRQASILTLLMVGRTGRQPQHIGTVAAAIATDFVVSGGSSPTYCVLRCSKPNNSAAFRWRLGDCRATGLLQSSDLIQTLLEAKSAVAPGSGYDMPAEHPGFARLSGGPAGSNL